MIGGDELNAELYIKVNPATIFQHYQILGTSAKIPSQSALRQTPISALPEAHASSFPVFFRSCTSSYSGDATLDVRGFPAALSFKSHSPKDAGWDIGSQGLANHVRICQ